jgi:hypothetical protein
MLTEYPVFEHESGQLKLTFTLKSYLTKLTDLKSVTLWIDLTKSETDVYKGTVKKTDGLTQTVHTFDYVRGFLKHEYSWDVLLDWVEITNEGLPCVSRLYMYDEYVRVAISPSGYLVLYKGNTLYASSIHFDKLLSMGIGEWVFDPYVKSIHLHRKSVTDIVFRFGDIAEGTYAGFSVSLAALFTLAEESNWK